MLWQRYVELEPVKRLLNEGRELLGKTIYVTEKRDGSNVSLWLDETDILHISSHNMEVADKDIQNRMKNVPEYKKIIDLLMDEKYQWHNDCIVYGELLQNISPTRIECKRKNLHWIMFDIYSKTSESFHDYNSMYQKGYHFKIPVVHLIDIFIPTSLDDLYVSIEKYKKWCARHRREGIVGKCYNNKIFFKEKIDLPKKPKLEKPQKSDIIYPPMPEDRILRALQHSYDELGEDNYKNKSLAMPIIARHIATEAREHYYNVPQNFYSWYVNTPMEKIKEKKLDVSVQ
jgi:hypothetical protein